MVTIPFERSDLGSTTQVTTQVTPQVEDIYNKIIAYCDEPRSTKEVTEFLGFKERKSASKYLKQLLQRGRIAMTIPDKPNSSKQKYIAIK